MTHRKELLASIRAYHKVGDTRGAMRLYIENRCISKKAYLDAIGV